MDIYILTSIKIPTEVLEPWSYICYLDMFSSLREQKERLTSLYMSNGKDCSKSHANTL